MYIKHKSIKYKMQRLFLRTLVKRKSRRERIWRK